MHRLGKCSLRIASRVLAAATAAVLAVALSAAPPASATAGPPTASNHVGHFMPAKNTTRSASSGARSGDFTTDGVADLLVRHASTGQLRVYPHWGAYSGVYTYLPAVTINSGWSSFRWIGQGDMNGDGNADVLYADLAGNMYLAPHSGTWNGTSTLLSSQWLGNGWQINDLIYTYDVTGDGLDDVLARRAGTGDTYLYRNTGGTGTAMLTVPQLVLSGGQADRDQMIGDFTRDGVPDVVFLQNDGWMGLFDFVTGNTYWLGYGWQGINAVTLTDVSMDGLPDIVGRRASDGTLLSYTHTGIWRPLPNMSAYATLRAPVVIGYNWQINDIIV